MMEKQIFERKNVKPLREALGWTQAEMAYYLGVSIFAVYSWEREGYGEKIRSKSAKKLQELAEKVNYVRP